MSAAPIDPPDDEEDAIRFDDAEPRAMPVVSPNRIGDTGILPEDIRMHPRMPSYEKRAAGRALDELRTCIDASRGLLVPVRLELDEDAFGAKIVANVLIPAYAQNLSHVKTTSIAATLEPKLRPLALFAYVAAYVHVAAAKLAPIEPPTDPDVIARCTDGATNALVAFFTHIATHGWNALAKTPRAGVDGHTFLVKEALHFARDEFGLEIHRAKIVVSHAATHADAKFVRPLLDAVAKQVEGELAFWSGEALRKIEAEIASERANAKAVAAQNKEREDARIAPASITKTPHELGAIVLVRDLGDGEYAMQVSVMRNPTSTPTQESMRDAQAFKCFAFPVFRELACMPEAAIVEEQAGPQSFVAWRIAPSDIPIALNKLDVRCAATVLAPDFVTNAVRRRARTLPNAEAPIDRAKLRNASVGFIGAMSLRRSVHNFLSRNAAALMIDSPQKLVFATMLQQAIVRGMLVDPLFAAGELRKGVRKMKDVTPWARDYFEAFFDRVDDGERMVNGGLGCFIAPGTLLEKGGA